jgi:hypothetical protein
MVLLIKLLKFYYCYVKCKNFNLILILYFLILILPLLSSIFSGIFGRYFGREGSAVLSTTLLFLS